MPQWVIVLVVGLISLVVGATSNDDRSWTWPFTWIGAILIIVAIVLALRSRPRA
jgi:fumarate reductase subunit D